jgi:D-alanyl-D-alanine carboxypeptidase
VIAAVTIAAGLSLAPAQARAVDAVVQSTMRAAQTPGVSLAIVRDGRIVYARGYGVRDIASRAPVDPKTVFRWGSVSKQFAAASILMLAAQGQLSLDDPVARWFPQLTHARSITIRDLLNQVSGYRDYFPLDYVDLEMSHPTTMAAILHEYAQAPLDAPERTRWEYSNTNFTLAGAVIERVSGLPPGRFYRRRIFGPLRMTSATYDDAPWKAGDDRATGYDSYWEEPAHRGPSEGAGWLNSAGALAGTASDLALWDVALMNHRILTAREFGQMTRARTIDGGRVNTHYGLGVHVAHAGGLLVVEHGGNVMGFASDNLMLPQIGTAVVVLTNSYEAPASQIGQRVAGVLVPELARQRGSSSRAAPQPGPAARAAVARIRRLLGELANGTVPRSAITADFAYLLNPHNRALAMDSLRRLGPVRNATWLRTAPRGGLSVTAARVEFAHGSATAELYMTPANRVAEIMLFP